MNSRPHWVKGLILARPSYTFGFFLAVAVLVYLSFWWNRVFGWSTEGWFPFYAEQFSKGLIPYRDFYLFSTPGHLFECLTVQELLGNQIIWIRFAGVLQRVGMALVLYAWLLRIFPAATACFSAMVALVLYSNDPPDVLFYMSHSAVFWALTGCYFVSRYIDSGRKRNLFLAGFMASMCFWTKQTTGVGIAALFFLILVLPRGEVALKAVARRLSVFALGWITVTVPYLLWLYYSEALPDFCNQVFGGGSSSKGSLSQILFRPLSITAYLWMALVMVILVGRSFRLRGLDSLLIIRKSPEQGVKLWIELLLSLLIAWPLGYAVYWAADKGLLELSYFHLFRMIDYIFLIASIVLCGFVWLALLVRGFKKGKSFDADALQLLLIAGCGLCVWFFFAISYPLFELMALPGAALLVGWLLHKDFTVQKTLNKGWKMVFLFFLTGSVLFKLFFPFDFPPFKEPSVYSESRRSHIQLLEGMRLSAGTADLLEEIVRDIQAHSEPGDSIYVYPDMPILYTLSEREASVKGYVHWFDVAPDFLVRMDFDLLKSDQPKVIVAAYLGNQEITFFESMFRSKGNSELRKLDLWLRSPGDSYTKVKTYNLGWRGENLEVWALKEYKMTGENHLQKP